MIRTSPFRFLAIVAVCLALTSTSCATQYVTTHAVERSPYEQAKLQYTALSLDYDFTMQSLEDIARLHPFTQRQRDILNGAEVRVKSWAPLVRAALDAWEKFGQKPVNYDATVIHISESLNEAKSIAVEVRQ